MLKNPVRSAPLFVLVVGLWLASCKKDTRVLDTGILPTQDLVSTDVAALTYTARTVEHDSIYSFNSREKFLGSSLDPVFGRMDIGLYLNANFSQVTGLFPADASFDSARFLFRIDPSNAVGDYAAALSFSVFPLDSALSRKRIYYTSNNRLHSRTALSTISGGDTVRINGNRYLRIALDKAYAETIFKDRDSHADVNTFQSKYKGFYIAPAAVPGTRGCIYTCDMDDAGSGLYFYFSSASSQTLSPFRFTFSGDQAVRYNTVSKDRSTANAALQSQLNGSLAGINLFVQGMGGSRVRFDLSFDKAVTDSFKVAVNRAELILPVDNDLNNGYARPLYLSLLPVGARGQDTIAADQYNVTDNARYSGMYDAQNGRYVFNIARHVQAILNGEIPNRGFHLVVSNPSKTSTLFRDEHVERVVLSGPTNPSQRPSFTLSYTKLGAK